MSDNLLLAAASEVRGACLCLHLQAAARTVGKRLDAALRPVGLTAEEYTLLVLVNRPQPACIGDVAQILVMDPSVVTVALERLACRGLLAATPDRADAGERHLELTAAGLNLLAQAVPAWRSFQQTLDMLLRGSHADALRSDLLALAFGEP